MVAGVLFASIYLMDRFLRPPTVSTLAILPGMQPSSVTGIQVIPAGALEIRAARTNNTWLLSKPIVYPAQPAVIESLLTALQNLVPATRISAAELREHGSADADFGFDSPQLSIVIEAAGQHWQLLVGNKTAPGDQVFLRVVGVDGAFVADDQWLKLIPHQVNGWRSTALVAGDLAACDAIVLTNGAKVIEFRRDATNRLWRMLRPLPARADSERITAALQQLRAAQVAQFVTDDQKADPATFGLQPADLDLWLNHGTNFISALHTGKSPTNDASLIYAKRERWSAVFTTAKEPLAAWHGTVTDFRDPHLLELSAPVVEIEVHGSKDFTLQRQGSNDWTVVGEKFPADAESVQQFIKVLADLRISQFVKDVVTASDLPAYGLTTPSHRITLRSAANDTNAVIAQLAFAVQTNGVFVQRADEDSIYAITLEDFNRLPQAGWEFRERHIWNFKEKDVVQITLKQNGETRQLLHNGQNKWSLAPGSQGIINPPAIEETVHRLGDLTVTGWVARNLTEPEKAGFKPDNLEITVELKDGGKYSVNFGAEISNQTALASVMLDGERWAFVFPPALYQFVLTYLTLPPKAP